MSPASETPADAAPIAVVIEDDVEVAGLLALVLAQTGFRPIVTGDGLTGVEAVRAHRPVLATVDVALPGIDGFEATRRIRQFSSTYIVMVSALTGEGDILGGFAAGADDYVAKPFRPRELRARFQAGLRRPPQRFASAQDAVATLPPAPPPPMEVVQVDGDRLVFRGLRLDPVAGRLEVDGDEVELPQLEFDLLELLLYAGTSPRTAGELALGLRGETYPAGSRVRDSDERVVVAAIDRLRDRIAHPDWIEDLGASGYRLVAPPS